MRLLGSTKNRIAKNGNSEKISHLDIAEVVLVHSNNFNKDYRYDSRVLYTFVPSKSFGQSLNILPKSFIFLKIFNSEFSYGVRFTD